MNFPFPKTSSYIRKQDLVSQVHRAWRQRVSDYTRRDDIQELEELLGIIQSDDPMKKVAYEIGSKVYAPVVQRLRKEHARFIIGTPEYERELDGYEGLTNSPFLYFVRENKLLEELEILQNPQSTD